MDESYFSHIPVLSAAMYAAVIKTAGPVLELGAGLGSTLLLHGLCGISKRQLLTLDHNELWLRKFMNFGRSWHQFKLVDSFLELEEYRQKWGLAFVDHGIAEQRGSSVLSLRDVADIIVCHDTCHYFLYNYEPILSSFKYRWNFKPHGLGGSNPMTTVVSQTINVGQMFAEAGL